MPQKAVRIPPGCGGDFSGAWLHADDATWAYRGRDDGGLLLLEAFRAFRPDGGEAPTPVARAARIELERTADGFLGEAWADVLHPTGRICTARYPAEVQSCGDGGLVLRAAAAVSLGDGCQTPLPPRTPVMLEHRLVRADPGQLRPWKEP